MLDRVKASCTHDAYIYKIVARRRGKTYGEWVPEGYARVEPDGELFIYLHSTPIGGFDGRVRCREYGSGPPVDKIAPQRPGKTDDHDPIAGSDESGNESEG